MADGAILKNEPALARLYEGAPESVSFRKLRKRLLQSTQEAIDRYAMTPAAGARWLVCLSGGKDSYTLLTLLMDLKAQGLLDADLLACNLDQGQPGFPKHVLPDYLSRIGAAHRIEFRDTYSVVTSKVPEGKTYCGLCSRLRRGNLYRIAREEGCSAIVLGHHRDDAIETLLLNMIHGGKLAAMPPKLLNDEGDLLVLRPLLLAAEADIAKFAEAMAFPIIPCTLCGSQSGLQREAMGALLADLEKKYPDVRETMMRALANANPSHLADEKIYDFSALALEPAAK